MCGKVSILPRRGFDLEIHEQRNVIERTVGKLKQLRRIATRCDRNPANCLAFPDLAALRCWQAQMSDPGH